MCIEHVVGFDYGPENGVDRLARHLYVCGGGACGDWDTGRLPDGVYTEYEQHAQAAIASYEGRDAA